MLPRPKTKVDPKFRPEKIAWSSKQKFSSDKVGDYVRVRIPDVDDRDYIMDSKIVWATILENINNKFYNLGSKTKLFSQ